MLAKSVLSGELLPSPLKRSLPSALPSLFICPGTQQEHLRVLKPDNCLRRVPATFRTRGFISPELEPKRRSLAAPSHLTAASALRTGVAGRRDGKNPSAPAPGLQSSRLRSPGPPGKQGHQGGQRVQTPAWAPHPTPPHPPPPPRDHLLPWLPAALPAARAGGSSRQAEDR